MRATGQIRATVLQQIEALWTRAPGYRDADVERLAALIVPRIEAGELQIANLTSVYLAQQAARLRGVKPEPERVRRAEILNSRGVPTRQLVVRSAIAVRMALSEGKPFPEAKAKGLTRMLSVTGTQLQLAKTTQAQASLKASGATYYRRVLSGSENCKLCVLAATQRYRNINKAAVHPGCDCGVEELPAGTNPRQVIDQKLLDSVNELVDEDGNELDPRDLITIHEHGELGPVLTWRKHEFTGPAALEL